MAMKAHHMTQVVRWERNFQSGHMFLIEEPRVDGSSIKDDLEVMKKVKAVILDDRRSTMGRVMVETVRGN